VPTSHSSGPFIASASVHVSPTDTHVTGATITVTTPNQQARATARSWVVNRFAPAPCNSNILGTIGGNLGVLCVRRDGGPLRQDGQAVDNDQGHAREIFGLDYPFPNQPEVILAGGRSGKVWRQDMRCAPSNKAEFRTCKGISHIRCASQHSIAIAGLNHKLAIYDVRWLKTQPTTVFSDYKNSASLNLGFDVDISNDVLAAANDDGTVYLYSLSSGFRLHSPEVDGLRSKAPIRSLMLDKLLGDTKLSLFIGEGPSIRKYTPGINDLNTEA
jgi:WD40 repeat protein